MDQSIKVWENRLRRKAARRGLRLVKSAQRDPGGLEYGRYRIEAADSAGSRASGYPLADLDEVERYLNSPR